MIYFSPLKLFYSYYFYHTVSQVGDDDSGKQDRYMVPAVLRLVV